MIEHPPYTPSPTEQIIAQLQHHIAVIELPIELLSGENNLTSAQKENLWRIVKQHKVEMKLQLDALTDAIHEEVVNYKQTEELRVEINTSDTTLTQSDEKLIEKLVELIEENIGNANFHVDDLSRCAGINVNALNRKLKILLGITANCLIRQVRLKRAAKLLKTGRYSVADVTYDVGFSDLKYFRECFKREYGMLPQQYKEECALK